MPPPGYHHSAEARQRMREAKLAHPTRYWLGKKRSPETIRKISENRRGTPAWNKGKHGIYSIETRRRISEANRNRPRRVGWHHSAAARRKMSKAKRGSIPWMKGRHHTPESKKRNSLAHLGMCDQEKHYNWKGGITPLVLAIRRSFKYREWRLAVFQRDTFTCIVCGTTGTYLEADHYPTTFSTIFHRNKIKNLAQAMVCKEFWDVTNGRTLCKVCHRKTPTFGSKKVVLSKAA